MNRAGGQGLWVYVNKSAGLEGERYTDRSLGSGGPSADITC